MPHIKVKVGTPEWKALLDQLAKNDPTLIELFIFNQIEDEGAKYLATVLEKNSVLHTLRLDSYFEKHNQIGDEGAKYLAAALEKNSVLHTLGLSGNKIEAEGAKCLAAALEKNSVLHTLDLGRNLIGDEGAKYLAAAVEKNSVLHMLDLSCQGIEVEGVRWLADALEKNSVLHTLKLGINQIGDEGTKYLATALNQNSVLHTLNLEKNQIWNEEAKYLLLSLQNNQTLIELDGVKDTNCQKFIQRNRIALQSFHRVIRQQQVDNVKQYLQTPVSLYAPTGDKEYSALHWAVLESNPAIISLLLETMLNRGFDVLASRDNQLQTAFELALNLEDNKRASILAKSLGEILPSIISKLENSPESKVFKRAQYQLQLYFQQYTKKFIVSNVFATVSSSKLIEILYWAIKEGQDAIVMNLLAPGLAYETKIEILYWTAKEGQDAIIMNLLAQGIACETKNAKGQTILHYAASAGKIKTVKILLAHAPQLLNFQDTQGFTPLHCAAISGQWPTCEYLLDEKANIEAVDKNGSTPLHLAAERSHRNTVEGLLNRKADIEARDKLGHTPLHLAAAAGQIAVIDVLIEHKAWLEAKDTQGWTALHWAAANNQAKVVTRLLKENVNYQALNKDGQTPRQLAKEKKHFEVSDLLADHGKQFEEEQQQLQQVGFEHHTMLSCKYGKYALYNKVYPSEVKDLFKQTEVAVSIPENQLWKKWEKASGNFGSVGLARNMQTGQFLAVKKIKINTQNTLDAQKQKEYVEGIEKESKLQKALEGQPNLMPLFDYKNIKDKKGMPALYQFMMFASFGDGQKLRRKLKLLNDTHELMMIDPLTKMRILIHMAKSLLKGVSCMHALKIYHLDIKPDNLLIDHLGRIYLSDFGCAIESDSPNIKQSEKKTNGDKRYFSPDRVVCCERKEAETFNAELADSWAIGVTLLELMGLIDTERFVPAESIHDWKDLTDVYFTQKLQKFSVLQKAPNNSFFDLIRKLLATDPQQRLTAKEALKHPIFTANFYEFASDEQRVHIFKFLSNLGEASASNSSSHQFFMEQQFEDWVKNDDILSIVFDAPNDKLNFQFKDTFSNQPERLKKFEEVIKALTAITIGFNYKTNNEVSITSIYGDSLKPLYQRLEKLLVEHTQKKNILSLINSQPNISFFNRDNNNNNNANSSINEPSDGKQEVELNKSKLSIQYDG